jgi:hypothetical protein
MRPTRPLHIAALLYLTSWPACSKPPHPGAVPPPAGRAVACAGAGVEQVEGVFGMTYGDPPAAGDRPRVSFTLALPDGTAAVLLIDHDLLGPYGAGRSLLGRRVVVAGELVRALPRTLRVCGITPL